MLKRFIVLFFFGFLTITIQAQNFGGGVILGLSTSQIGGDDLAGFNKAGVLIGVFTNKSISESMSFQMEMTYIQKGSNNPKMNENRQQDISMSYIEIPLLLQYHQSRGLKIEAGVQIAHLIKGYYNDLSGKITSVENPFISYDIGLLIGVDYKYSEKISINTRISNSILPIGAEDYENSGSYNSLKKGKYNSVLSFTINYNI